MRLRVFVGLPVSGRLQTEILNWEKKFSNLPVRWLQGKNLHITLVPPWYEEDLEKVKNSLQVVVGSGAFEMEFYKVSFGPNPRQPRLIWAEGETPKELLDLQEKLYRDPKLQMHANLRKEKRPLKLHLTLARFRPETFSSFPIKELDEKVDWRDKVDRVVLFESILSRGGADYEVISETPLNI